MLIKFEIFPGKSGGIIKFTEILRNHIRKMIKFINSEVKDLKYILFSLFLILPCNFLCL